MEENPYLSIVTHTYKASTPKLFVHLVHNSNRIPKAIIFHKQLDQVTLNTPLVMVKYV